MELLAWIGAITGPLGAILLAANIRISGYGYILFIISSVAMLIVGLSTDNHQLVTMNLLFTVINCIGAYRWLTPRTRSLDAEMLA